MNTINTLTVNGATYALPDPKSVLDDSAVSTQNTWSGQKLAAMDASAAIVCGASGTVISLADASDRALQGLTVYGRTVQDGTPTPDAPIALESPGAGGSIGVTVAGSQLLPYSYKDKTTTSCGITFADQGDNTYAVTGTATATASIVLATYELPAGTYTMSGTVSPVVFQINKRVDSTETMIANVTSTGSATFKLSEKTKVRVYLIVAKNAVISGEAIVKPMLNAGDIALPFEPYKAQSLTLSTPNGLSGIPVESGGNYTDADGQQWVCDEIDLTRGVYVQRVQSVTYDGTETWLVSTQNSIRVFEVKLDKPGYRSNMMTTFGYKAEFVYAKGNVFIANTNLDSMYIMPYEDYTVDTWKQYLAEKASAGTPLAVQYKLVTPIETDLTAEEIAAYATLHTVKPNTTVYNDASAHMELSYVADTKTYIDNKFNELAAALVNNT